jgi:hypothetical protein
MTTGTMTAKITVSKAHCRTMLWDQQTLGQTRVSKTMKRQSADLVHRDFPSAAIVSGVFDM